MTETLDAKSRQDDGVVDNSEEVWSQTSAFPIRTVAKQSTAAATRFPTRKLGLIGQMSIRLNKKKLGSVFRKEVGSSSRPTSQSRVIALRYLERPITKRWAADVMGVSGHGESLQRLLGGETDHSAFAEDEGADPLLNSVQ